MLSRYQSILIGRFIDLITYSCETSNPWFVKTHTAQRVAAGEGDNNRERERERKRQRGGDRSLADRSASNAADLNDLGISCRRATRRARDRQVWRWKTQAKSNMIFWPAPPLSLPPSPLLSSDSSRSQSCNCSWAPHADWDGDREADRARQRARQSTVCCSYIFISNRFTAVRFGSVLGIMYARHKRGKAHSPQSVVQAGARRAQCHLWNHFGGTFHISCAVFNIFIGHHRCH